MNERWNQLDWIDRHLTGNLTAPELEEFEGMQREDGSFRELVEEMKLLAGGIRSSARDSLRAEMQEWERNQSRQAVQYDSRRAVRLGRIGWISMAAAACLAAVLYLEVIRPPYSERLANNVFDNYYSGAYPNVVDMTYRSDPTGTGRDEAYKAYDLENYREAAAIWSELAAASDTVMFFLGNAYLETGEYAKAAFYLGEVVASRAFLPEQAKWLLGLALLRDHRIDEALDIFRGIAAVTGDYREKAAEIIEKLKQVL